MRKARRRIARKRRKIEKEWRPVHDFYQMLLYRTNKTRVDDIIDQWRFIMKKIKPSPYSRLNTINEMVLALADEGNPVLFGQRVNSILKAFQPCFQ